MTAMEGWDLVRVLCHTMTEEKQCVRRERVTDDRPFRLDVSPEPRAEPHELNTSCTPDSLPCYSGIMSSTHAY